MYPSKSMLTKVKQAINHYHMLANGDVVAVGLSGGKDSVGLLYLLHELRLHSHLNFELCAIHLDYGWESQAEIELLKDFALNLNIPCYIEKINYPTDNYTLNCSICARVRRGALLQKATTLGVNKLALGHHLDDAVQTTLLNLIDGGRFRSFKPTIYYPKQNLTLIRPMIYLRENSLQSLCAQKNLPIIPSHCPIGSCTNRTNATQLLTILEESNPKITEKILHALEHLESDDAWLR